MSATVKAELGSSPLVKPATNGNDHALPTPTSLKMESIDMTYDSDDETKPKLEDPNTLAQAKIRHEADLKKHHYEAPKADRIQDDWQVAYVWAFIVKFDQLASIRKLECIEDFERSLSEPVANRPDDILEGILIHFLSNLKPGLRNLDCTNIQRQLSSYISDMLRESPEFTVWDRPWAPNEEGRGSCCNPASDRSELGRLRYPGEPAAERVKKNPILQMEERGGGLFELDWRERAKLLRQMVDWQLSHSEQIRGILNKEFKVETKLAKASTVEGLETSVVTVPLGLDRDKTRIWAFDNSCRIYKSGNPFKRPCPLYSMTTNRTEFDTLLERYKTHANQQPGKLRGSGPNGKPTGPEMVAHKKLLRGIDDEKKLAEKIEEMLPLIEKEEARVQRARRRITQAQELAQQADFRSTRTRRTTKKVDYTYDGDGDDDELEAASTKRQRAETTAWEGSSTRGRPIIPGERKSARMSLKEKEEVADTSSTVGGTRSNSSTRDTSIPLTATEPSSANTNGTSVASDGNKKPKKALKRKRWEYVEEIVPVSQLKPKERERWEREQATLRAQAEQAEVVGKEQELGEEISKGQVDALATPAENGTAEFEMPAIGNVNSSLSYIPTAKSPSNDSTVSMELDEGP